MNSLEIIRKAYIDTLSLRDDLLRGLERLRRDIVEAESPEYPTIIPTAVTAARASLQTLENLRSEFNSVPRVGEDRGSKFAGGLSTQASESVELPDVHLDENYSTLLEFTNSILDKNPPYGVFFRLCNEKRNIIKAYARYQLTPRATTEVSESIKNLRTMFIGDE